MRMAIICGALALTIATASAVEINDSVKFMLPYCKIVVGRNDEKSADSAKAFNSGRCAGAIETIIMMMNLLKMEQEAGVRHNPPLCADIPADVRYGQLLEVVVTYSKMHPEVMRQPFGIVAMTALNQAWPCKRTSEGPAYIAAA